MNKVHRSTCQRGIGISPPRSHLVTKRSTRLINFRLTPSGLISTTIKVKLIDATKVPGTNLSPKSYRYYILLQDTTLAKISIAHHITLILTNNI